MKEIGEFLKSARIENGVSIEEASDDLHVTSTEIENLEEGNVKAFKDVYFLKDLVKEYSKYLGQDPDTILDEFNDFMFEHTSKISLDDIKEARKMINNDDKPKIVSPYTYIRKKKISFKDIPLKKIGIAIGIVLILICLHFIGRAITTKNRVVNNELKGVNIYEYAN